ncbi:MAG: alpha/beta fold hydrolase [Desulfobacteraceae bacterium]
MKQEIRFCTTPDGVRLAYATLGSGPPLVKVANWLSHIEHEWQCPVWRHYYENLGKKYTLIRYDQRGCGLSDRHFNDLSFESWIQDLETVVDAVGLKRFPLLGISQGGPVAIAYTERNVKKVCNLILYGSYLRGRLHRDSPSKDKEEVDTLINLIKLGWRDRNPAFLQVFTSLFIPEGNPEQIQWLNDFYTKSTSIENAISIFKCCFGINISHLANKIQVPTLVMHAKDDALVPFDEGRLVATLIPGAQFFPLESRNHILLRSEAAWQDFLEAIDNFIGNEETKIDNGTSLQFFYQLTKREIEVLDLIAQGLSNDQISNRLYISPNTVRNHITNILSKLGVETRSNAIVIARNYGLGLL